MVFEERYAQGYSEGTLMGEMTTVVKILDSEALPDWTEEKTAKILLGDEDLAGYLREIRAVLARYRGYSLNHKVKKVIFECSYLPYHIPKEEKSSADEEAKHEC